MRLELIDNLFDRDNGPFRCQNGFLLNAYDSPDQYVATTIGLLGVDDGHVWALGRNGGQLLPGERTLDASDHRVHLGEVGADITTKDGKG